MVRKHANGKHTTRRAGAKGTPKSKHTTKAKPAKAAESKAAESKAAKPAFGRRASTAKAASHRPAKKGDGPLGFLRRLNPF